MTVAEIGVLVMAYGGPDRMEDVAPYLRDVRNFRPTPDPLIQEVRERYARIGGRSPIRERTEAQAAALQRALDDAGDHFRTIVGMRHWHPYISDALARLEAEGIQRAVGLVMAPHYSRMSIGDYFKKVTEAGSPIQVAPIERWHLLPGYLAAITERIINALSRLPPEGRGEVPVIFTAHSLPERILSWDDPYPRELQATVQAVMDRLGPRPCHFAYQSAAMTPEPWLGPDTATVMTDLASRGASSVIIAPIGFTCEHVEVLYDIDVELQRLARHLGIRLVRTEMVNDAPAMMAGLAALVREAAGMPGWL